MAFGYTDEDSEGRVDIEVTVNAADERAAYGLATSCVRAAIQAAGGCTPDWEHFVPADDELPVYSIEDGRVTLMAA